MSDVPWVREDVKSVCSPSDHVREVTSGPDALAAIKQRAPDLAVLDLQTGAMGGIATCLELRLEESGGRMPHVPVLLLLDRRPDVFLARRAQAEGWVVKPLDPIRLRRAVRELLRGGVFEDDTRSPVPVLSREVASLTAGDVLDTSGVAAVEQGGGDG